MIVIVGLGNPDKKYEFTNHNMGYLAVDYFAKENGIKFSKRKYNSMCGEGLINGEKVTILKPTTYMNNSGVAVRDVVKQLKLPLCNLIVLYDDIDIPCGALRYRKSGSAGTHNGMRSIVSTLGTEDFARLRVGTGKDPNIPLVDFVLSRISKENMETLNAEMPKINRALLYFISQGGNVDNIDFNTI